MLLRNFEVKFSHITIECVFVYIYATLHVILLFYFFIFFHFSSSKKKRKETSYVHF